MTSPKKPQGNGFKNWLLEGINQGKPATEQLGFYEEEKAVKAHNHTHPWWKVMCLTGVDYFSTLGYQPGIAALAAGAVSPIATLVLVLITLFGALPMYRRVAEESPHGDGSISMLERLLSYWPSKILVLALIGFVATGFVITITLSAADATAHVIENPFVHNATKGLEIPITLGLIALLGAVFLKGFNEAVGIAVAIVVLYIGMSLVVVGFGVQQILAQPESLSNWTNLLATQYSSPLAVIGAALLVFPRLALGLSGFETGVVVMPLVRGEPGDTESHPKGRIRNTKKLLLVAAVIMSVMLISSAFVTTLLIPHAEFLPSETIKIKTNTQGLKDPLPFKIEGLNETLSATLPTNVAIGEEFSTTVRTKEGETLELTGLVKGINNDAYTVTLEKRAGEAYGRALAYLAHKFLGDGIGTVYDIATILILWFAGASAMAGLLNIVPRYLPRFGMAPDWTRATRPMVLLFTAICFLVTVLFNASVTAQASAYATGVLALMTSAAVAVTLSAIRSKQSLRAVVYGLTSLVFIYTTTVTIIEQPDGLRIALFFIAAILAISVFSRVSRSTELRVERIELDDTAQRFLRQAGDGPVRLIANHQDEGDGNEYDLKELEIRYTTHLPKGDPTYFLEVKVSDASKFSDALKVRGVEIDGYQIFQIDASSIPNAIAAFLLYVRDHTTLMPHAYFEWDQEHGPMHNAGRFLLSGEGDIPPLTHEILRKAEPNPKRRPLVHVGG